MTRQDRPLTETKQPSLAALKDILFTNSLPPSAEFLAALAKDTRSGAQKLRQRYEKGLLQEAKRSAAFEARFAFEREYWTTHKYIAGVDEVGRGPLAGPVVSAAVILPKDFSVLDVNDSKQLTKHKRDELFLKIIEQAVAVGIGIESAQVIDQVNIYEATRLAMAAAVSQLDIQPTLLLVDAMQVPVEIEQVRLVKGDAKSNSIAAASIVAKVLRDRLMDSYDAVFPGYGFSSNAGYGTNEHLLGLERLGACFIHRRSFAPVSQYLVAQDKN